MEIISAEGEPQEVKEGWMTANMVASVMAGLMEDVGTKYRDLHHVLSLCIEGSQGEIPARIYGVSCRTLAPFIRRLIQMSGYETQAMLLIEERARTFFWMDRARPGETSYQNSPEPVKNYYRVQARLKLFGS